MTRHRNSFLLLSASVLAGAFGCADGGDTSIVILNNMSPPEDPTAPIEPSEMGPFSSSFRVNVATPTDVFMIPLLKNVASSESSTLTTNRTFFADGFQVNLSSFDAATTAAIATKSFMVPKGFSIPPDGSLGVSVVLVMSKVTVADIGATLAPNTSSIVNVDLELQGKMGGSSAASNTFHFPIVMCSGTACD